MQSTLKFKGWLMLAITILMLILQITAPSRTWSMLFVGFALIQATALGWARSLQTHLYLFRERRYTWAQVGDRIEERFTINNHSFLPALWIQIIDHSTLPGYTVNQVRGLGTHTFTRWHTEGVCTQRGIFQLGPTELSFGDPFGLFEVHQMYPNKVDFTIVPPILPLTGLEVVTQSQLGEATPRPYNLMRSQLATTIRPYQPGDSLKHIHWPSTARRDNFYVHNLTETSSGDWWLVLDLDKKAHQGQGENSTLEKAILIASFLVDKGLRTHHAVGLLAQGNVSIWQPPQASTLQRWQILKTLAQVQGGDLNLADLLTRSRPLLGRRNSLVIITASTSLAWLDPLVMLMRQGIVPTIILIFNADTQSTIENSQQILVSQGIQTHLVDQSAIEPPSNDHAAGQWEWQITGTGKAIAIHKPKGSWEKI